MKMCDRCRVPGCLRKENKELREKLKSKDTYIN